MNDEYETRMSDAQQLTYVLSKSNVPLACIIRHMLHKVNGLTDIGCVRDHNEDALLIDQDLGLYVVCDGLGGHAAGEVASQLACSTIQDHIKQRPELLAAARGETTNVDRRDAAVELVQTAVQAANKAIYDKAQTDPKFRGMGCTSVLLLMLGRCAVIAHAGDSRAYLMRGTHLFQLTEDHSWIDEQLKRGLITPEQARRRDDQSRITRAVGTRPQVEAETLFFDLLSRDRFLLCSDGLTRHLAEEDFYQHFAQAEQAKSMLEMPGKIVQLAKDRGGYDNITALVINISEVDEAHDQLIFRKFDVIKQVPLFKYFNYMELVKVLSVSKVHSFNTGDLVIRQGDQDQSLYVCIDGSVTVSKNNQPIAKLVKGDFFGEMSLMDKHPRSADVIAAEPSRMLIIDREHFLNLIERERHLGIKILWKICRVLNQRLRDTSEDLAWSKVMVADGPEDALNEMAKTL